MLDKGVCNLSIKLNRTAKLYICVHISQQLVHNHNNQNKYWYFKSQLYKSVYTNVKQIFKYTAIKKQFAVNKRISVGIKQFKMNVPNPYSLHI